MDVKNVPADLPHRLVNISQPHRPGDEAIVRRQRGFVNAPRPRQLVLKIPISGDLETNAEILAEPRKPPPADHEVGEGRERPEREADDRGEAVVRGFEGEEDVDEDDG